MWTYACPVSMQPIEAEGTATASIEHRWAPKPCYKPTFKEAYTYDNKLHCDRGGASLATLHTLQHCISR